MVTDTINAHNRNSDEVLAHYQVQPGIGLSTEEVNARQKKYGKNKLMDHKKKSILQMFFSQLNDALIYVLLAAVVITFVMGEFIDGIIILIVVFINAVLGVVQQVKAGNAIEALRNLSAPKAIIRRDGQQLEINAEDIVPGDIVVLEAGRYIPADLRLVESVNLQIDESALTGESVAVEKDSHAVFEKEYTPVGDRLNMAYMTSLVTYGRGLGVVTGTGNNTEVGKIAKIIQDEDETKTPLEIRLDELGKTLGKIAVGVCVLMFIIAYFQERDLTEMFMTAVSLAVASIPEGLAAIVAIVLSIGITKMAKQNAIIKKLPAVETLGSVNIVCSDKTGTLTQNKMTVTELFTFSDTTIEVDTDKEYSAEARLLAEAMVLSSDATLENGNATGDPTEIALLMLADHLSVDRQALMQSQPRVDELAFDSNRKMMSTLHEKDGSYVLYTKGAVDNLMLKCKSILENGNIVPLTETHKYILLNAAETMSDNALRTLAVAFKPLEKQIDKQDYEKKLIMIGVVGMIDPPREEVRHAIQNAKEAGITTIMITGDHKNTAFAIAKELDIATQTSEVTTGVDINNMSQEALASHIGEYKVFARVSPEHKVNIVKAFKAKGNIVSMTGDGVNDAPSLNAADIGVAMGITGTDVAKNASDMILADDNFATIITAIEQGRNIYNNIKKSVIFLLASNVGEVICMLLAIIAGMPIPLIATQLLWINLLTDTLPAIALGMDPGSKDVMKDKPRSSKESFFAGGATSRIIIGGVMIGVLTIIAFVSGYSRNGYSVFDPEVPDAIHEYARTLAFMTIIACQLFYSLSFRHDKKPVFKVGIFSNIYLVGAIVLGFLLQTLVLYIPVLNQAFKLQELDIKDWGEIMLLGLIPFLVNEMLKLIRYGRSKENKF